MAYTQIFLLIKYAKASLIFFFRKNTCELDIVITRTINILTTNELVKLTMLWTTGPSSRPVVRTSTLLLRLCLIYSLVKVWKSVLRIIVAFSAKNILNNTTPYLTSYSRLLSSRIPRDSLKHFEITVHRNIRAAEVRKTINRTTTFNEWICNLTTKVRDIRIENIVEKRRNCNFSSFPHYFVTCS